MLTLTRGLLDSSLGSSMGLVPGEASNRVQASPIKIKTTQLHCKKRLAIFPSPAGMSLTKLSLAGNILIILGQGGFGK
jgi:hypothetical protein